MADTPAAPIATAADDDVVTLVFDNRTAAGYGSPEARQELRVARASAHLVARWYGGYCGGDDYDVIIDGRIVDKDLNGEIEPS